MRYQTSLLTGEPVSIDVPDGTLARPVRTSVLIDSGVELEVNAGAAEAADFYLESTRTRLSGSVQLAGGMSLRTGALGGDPKAGLGYRVTASADEVLFGSAAPSMTLEALARTLAAARIGRGPRGVQMAPSGPAAWSPYRSHDLNQSVRLSAADGYLLDVRRVGQRGAPSKVGVRVRGGRLTRSAPGSPSHVVLETTDFVVYGVPKGATSLDRLATSMSRVEVSRQ